MPAVDSPQPGWAAPLFQERGKCSLSPESAQAVRAERKRAPLRGAPFHVFRAAGLLRRSRGLGQAVDQLLQSLDAALEIGDLLVLLLDDLVQSLDRQQGDARLVAGSNVLVVLS